MSDSLQIFTRLDALDIDALRLRTTEVVRWLNSIGITKPDGGTANEADQPTWEAGPQWIDAVRVDAIRVESSLYAREVTVSVDQLILSALENSEDPRCGNCFAALDSDVMSGWDVVDTQGQPVPNPRPGPFAYNYGELIDEWLASAEPDVSCVRCNWTAPLGDWVTDFFPGLVGAPTITFRDWPQLNQPFIQRVIHQLGGRSRYICAYN